MSAAIVLIVACFVIFGVLEYRGAKQRREIGDFLKSADDEFGLVFGKPEIMKTGDKSLFDKKDGDFVRRESEPDEWVLCARCCGKNHVAQQAPDICPECGEYMKTVRVLFKTVVDYVVKTTFFEMLGWTSFVYSEIPRIAYHCNEIYDTYPEKNLLEVEGFVVERWWL